MLCRALIMKTHKNLFGRRLRKASLKRFKRRVRRLQKEYAVGKVNMKDVMQQISSWLAHAKHGNAEKVIDNFLEKHTFQRVYTNGNPRTK